MASRSNTVTRRAARPAADARADALAENESAREAMQSDTLRLMARELTEMVKKMPKLDWTQRESVRASLRRSVRRLLARHGYPPDLAEGATQLVLRQAELSTENSAL
jgi:type I restriction enzyme R subunit|nr:type I restriction enzyme endonuclease domain-containing protein [Halochromatium glycolicum]